MKTLVPAVVALLASLAGPSVSSPVEFRARTVSQEYEKLSPFEAVRWRAQVPEVRVRERWYELTAINGVASADIVAFCRTNFGDRAVKRFEEDLVEVLTRMGHAPAREVTLELKDLETSAAVKLERVPMTEENRRAVRDAAKARGEFPKVSPFEAVRWRGDVPEVRVRGVWYELGKVDGAASSEIVAFAKRTYGNRAVKRFEEDLVQVLTEMGRAPGTAVRLDLTQLESGAAVTLERVEMTEANRRAIWEAAVARDGAGPSATVLGRVERKHASKPAARYASLARFLDVQSGRTIPRAQAEQDLDQLEWLIVHAYAYRDRAGVDWPGAFDAVRSGLSDACDVTAFSVQLMKLVALAGDGHSRVDAARQGLPDGFLPFLVEECGERAIAFRSDRSGFVDADHPVIESIDGLPLERWLAASALMAGGGSPQHLRRNGLRYLRNLQLVRLDLGRAPSSKIEVELADLAGKSRKQRTLDLAAQRPVFGQRIGPGHRVLADNIGYLRVHEMSDAPEFIAELERAMESFRDSRGLIIDVRENGGGSRAALRTLFPYFMRAGEAPWVANVSACRLAEGQDPNAPEGYLEDRWLYPASAKVWRDEDRAAIASLARSFRPEWQPPAKEFSAWHYLVLRRDDNPKAYAYDKPVVILLDGGCFSATDIFLGAFKGRKGVTLIGTPSGGGSGRARTHALAHSGLAVSLSSMVSFRRDGRLYDGRGIEPDVTVQAAPEDLLGRTDAVLAEALKRLR